MDGKTYERLSTRELLLIFDREIEQDLDQFDAELARQHGQDEGCPGSCDGCPFYENCHIV